MEFRFPVAIWGDTSAEFCADTATLDPEVHIDTVLAFVFHENQFLLANISERGWSIPGGRVEAGESLLEAIKRESYEETGASLVDLEEIGYYRLVVKSPVGNTERIVLVFIARAGELKSIPKGFESIGVRLVDLNDLREVYYMWDPLIEAVCNYAHSRAVLQGWSA